MKDKLRISTKDIKKNQERVKNKYGQLHYYNEVKKGGESIEGKDSYCR